MNKRYIFLIISLVLIIFITYLIKDDYKKNFIDETKKEISEIHNDRDSIFLFAEEVLNDVSESKKNDANKIDTLGFLVKNKQKTIEQQIRELNNLVKESNQLRELAEKQTKIAIEMRELSTRQKIEAEKAKLESIKQLNELEEKCQSLIEENENYKKIIKLLEEELSYINYTRDSLLNNENKKRAIKKKY